MLKNEKCIFKMEIVTLGLFPRDKCLISQTIHVLNIIHSIWKKNIKSEKCIFKIEIVISLWLISKRQMPYLANDLRFGYYSFNMKKIIIIYHHVFITTVAKRMQPYDGEKIGAINFWLLRIIN